MAKNTEEGSRVGCVKNRAQFLNPKTGLWTKINTVTKQIMDVKTTGGKFKGVKTIKKKKSKKKKSK